MHAHRVRPSRGMVVAATAVWLMVGTSARAQVMITPYYGRSPQRTRGTYGPGMSFGEFGYRLNTGYAFGNPYGGLGGGIGYGFGSRVGTGYGPGNSLVYTSAYNTPGTGPGFAGYYPPLAVYGYSNQNPAVFPPGSPNYPGFWSNRGVPVRPYYQPPTPLPGPR